MNKRCLQITVLLIAMLLVLSSCTSGGEGGSIKVGTVKDIVNLGQQLPVTDKSLEEQEKFEAFIDEQFYDYIQGDYISMHIYYKDPEAQGFDMDAVDVSLGGGFTKSSMDSTRRYYESIRRQFEKFDRAKLTERQMDIYDAFDRELDIAEAMSEERFDYYTQLLSPVDGTAMVLSSLFTNWELRSERDVQDIITLLDDVDRYVDDVIKYSKEQQKKQLLITDFERVKETCQDVLDTGTDSIVLTGLYEEVDKLNLGPEKTSDYKDQILQVFNDSYLAGYENLRNAMDEMKDGWVCSGGWSELPNGSDYYTLLLQYATATDFDTDTMYNYLSERYTAHGNKIYSIYFSNEDAVNMYFDDTAPSTGFTSYDEILKFLETKMWDDFPMVGDLEYEIKAADPEEKLADQNVVAYFLIPPMDEGHLQRMRVDPESGEIDAIDTYVTVSHEGFPGHMYQFAWMYENEPSEYVKTYYANVYTEGYAFYVQGRTLEYLGILPQEYIDFYRENDAQRFCLFTMADIGINYYGWDVNRVKNFFNDEGYSLTSDIAQEIYDDFRFDAAAYAPYCYGCEIISEMREYAELSLGDKFTEMGFHEALLSAGPLPMDITERHIQKYIDENM